ncbi:sensor histidine kinase [Halobacteriovorax sp. HLS]|uniref:sensor histidine kinase n=1 Tax=Halobacteriovorax sp. HLS TaxID=2234000 RepID=UPI000FDB999B|nr:ATP-binding protein [Halobacteriovorax sp. HLS]
MKSKLLPRKLSIFALIITIQYAIGSVALLYKLSNQFEEVHKYHFPILEMNAINVRLGQSLSNTTKNLIYEYSEEGFQEYIFEKNSLQFNISMYIAALKEAGKENLINDQLNRDKLNKFEEKIIFLAKNKKTKEALKLFKSKIYSEYKESYIDNIQIVAEELIIDRDKLLENKSKLFKMGVVLSVVFFIFLSLLWIKVYMSYKKNSLEKYKAELDLEVERVKSSQNAKMASLGEMAAGLAHEINNPLAIIMGYSNKLDKLIERKMLNEENLLDLSSKIKKTTLRISSIIKGLKAFSRDSQDDPPERTSVIDIINDTLSFCQEKFKYNGVRLDVNHSNKNLDVLVRPVEISQVLLNLINNSFDEISDPKYNEPWVRIDTEVREDMITIVVSDCGKGITDEIAQKMFEPFFTTKDVNKGTGLGLSISRSIIEKHGGSFILNRDFENTTFEITLPRYTPEESEQDQNNSSAA